MQLSQPHATLKVHCWPKNTMLASKFHASLKVPCYCQSLLLASKSHATVKVPCHYEQIFIHIDKWHVCPGSYKGNIQGIYREPFWYICDNFSRLVMFFELFWPPRAVLDPGTPLESFNTSYRLSLSSRSLTVDHFVTFSMVWSHSNKLLLGSYKLFTSMNVHLCLFMSRDGQDDSPNMQEQEEK